jgi:hypothetical protein
VISKNLKRRHLDEGQRAYVAAKIENMRQGERTDLGNRRATSGRLLAPGVRELPKVLIWAASAHQPDLFGRRPQQCPGRSVSQVRHRRDRVTLLPLCRHPRRRLTGLPL